MIAVGQRGSPRQALAYLNGLVRVGRGNIPSVRGPGDAIDPPMAAIHPKGFVCRGVPDLYGLVKAHRGEILAIGRPGNGGHYA